MEKYKFDCGCEFDILGPSKDGSNIPLCKFDIKKVCFCSRVKKLFALGKTKGVFQLEEFLGQKWSKDLKPENLEHLSALVAILRPGTLKCLSEDTVIVTSIRNSERSKSGRRKYDNCYLKISELYKKFHRNHVNYNGNIGTINEDTLEAFNNKIKNVIYNGKKEVFKPKFKNRKLSNYLPNNTLECTDDHKLLTHNRGWVELKDIKIGERVAIISTGIGKTGKYKNRNLSVGERNFGDLCFYNYEYKCIFCDWCEGSLDVNHLEGNRKTNNHPDNLCFMCPNHHRLYSEKKITKEQAIKAREKYKLKNAPDNFVCWAEYLGKESLGVKDVYDISVEGPHHNFIAGGVVVHNCKDEKGISMTQHYCLRKNGEELIQEFHAVYDDVLKETYSIIVYQEQAMRLAVELAGFNKQEADDLRKAIGKKLSDEMNKVKKKFIDKAKTFGVIDEEKAAIIMDWIQESARYSFNKCLSPDTLVETESGYKTIEEVSIGEKVLTPNGFSEVINKHDNGEKEVYEITLESGKSIKCTIDHKFLCEDNVIRPLYEIIDKNYKIVCQE